MVRRNSQRHQPWNTRLRVEPLENRCVPAAGLQHGVWHLGSDHGTDPADIIVLQLDPNDGSQLQAVINGEVVTAGQLNKIRQITIRAGKGNDQVTADLGNLPIRLKVLGGEGDDSLMGGRGADLLIGGPGDDTIEGRGGIDVVFGGVGADQIKGGGSDDHLEGGRGSDVLQGGDGHDLLAGGQGADRIFRQVVGDHVIHDHGDLILRDHTSPGSTLNQEQVAHFKQWLTDSALDQWADLLGQPIPNHWWYDGSWNHGEPMMDGGPMPADGISIGVGGGAGAAESHSNTNTQVQGVDEADFVKTDGNYLYLVQNDELWIIDTAPADGTLAVTARIPINGWIEGLYVFENHVTVLSSTWTWHDAQPGPIPIDGDPSTGAGDANGVGVTLGIANGSPIWWGGGTQQVQMTVIDVTNHGAPTIVEETTYDGYLVSSRSIDDRVYLVVQNDLHAPMPEVIQNEGGEYFYESRESYLEHLLAWATEEQLPGYSSIIVGAGDQTQDGSLIDTPNLYLPDNGSGEQVLSVIIADVDDATLGPTATTTVAGIWSGQVYASSDNMYIVSQGWDQDSESPTSDIHKFELGTEAMPYVASGTVTGYVLNTFSMDEFDGAFRIATTNGWGGESSNSVFVLQQTGTQLEVVGAITHLAVGESIYAVRFLGDRGFVVTFHQIDPLFTLDLSDATNPRVVGELEMPGYSTYLHPFGDDRLIGFGREVEGNHRGDLQLSLFDVSNLANPKRLDHFVFANDVGPDDGWSYSEAEWNHHAFSLFDDAGILAVPVQQSGWTDADGYVSHASLAVFKIDATTGFTLLGEVGHDGAALRSFRIGDLLYSIGTDAVQVVALTDPTQHVATLALATDYAPHASL